MRAVLAVARRELATLAASPSALGIAAAFHLWTSLAYRRLVEAHALAGRLAAERGAVPSEGLTEGVLVPLFVGTAFTLALFVPFLTMRLVAGERRSGFEDVLLSLPLDGPRVVAGKYLALAVALTVLVAPVPLLPLALPGAAADPGVLSAGAAGLLLAALAYGALGLACSSVAADQRVAAAVSLVLLLVLFFADRLAGGAPSLRLAVEPFARGVLSLEHTAAHVALAFLSLFLAAQGLELRRRTR